MGRSFNQTWVVFKIDSSSIPDDTVTEPLFSTITSQVWKPFPSLYPEQEKAN